MQVTATYQARDYTSDYTFSVTGEMPFEDVTAILRQGLVDPTKLFEIPKDERPSLVETVALAEQLAESHSEAFGELDVWVMSSQGAGVVDGKRGIAYLEGFDSQQPMGAIYIPESERQAVIPNESLEYGLTYGNVVYWHIVNGEPDEERIGDVIATPVISNKSRHWGGTKVDPRIITGEIDYVDDFSPMMVRLYKGRSEVKIPFDLEDTRVIVPKIASREIIDFEEVPAEFWF
tara:strand:+ start:58 stop:756 length:699 start_codon:yes stop_codon:yes gene_type:complete